MANCPHKPIFYPSTYYDGSNVIRLTWSGNQPEDYTTHNFQECLQYADHTKIINKISSVLGIINTLLGIVVRGKVHIQLYVASVSTDG